MELRKMLRRLESCWYTESWAVAARNVGGGVGAPAVNPLVGAVAC